MFDNKQLLHTASRSAAFYMQQIGSLWVKRARIFRKRYVIAGCSLLMPLLSICIAKYIPSAYTIVVESLMTTRPLPVYDLNEDWSDLKRVQNIPYSLYAGNESQLKYLDDLFQRHILLNTNNNNNHWFRPILMNDSSTSIDSFVYEKRLASVSNILGDYFAGLSLNLTKENVLDVTLYHSTMAFHASASLLNRVNTLLLNFYANSTNKRITTYNAPVMLNRLSSSDNDSDKDSQLDLSTESSSMNDEFVALSCIESLPFSTIDFICSIIIAFLISLTSIHLTRERLNKSKSLQVYM